MENVRIVSETRASSADVEFIRDGLSLYNVAATADSYYAPLAIFARDERDAILGGGYGHVWGGDGWTSLCCGSRSRYAARATAGSSSKPRKTRQGPRTAAASF